MPQPDRTPDAAITRRERHRAMKRGLWTHPHVTIWRAWLWLRWKRVPPWRMRLVQLAMIDPRPLPPEKLAKLRALLALRYPETIRRG